MKIEPFPIELIKDRMKDILKTNIYDIDTILEYLLATNGKMIRPRLVYLTASLYPHNTLIITDIAVAVELIHMASLVHDDVIDHASIRRGAESINSRWGNQISVLTGDYLFATAFNLINKHNQSEIMDSITETIQIMCSGEIKQLSMSYNIDLTEEDYFDKTYRKTACLFASSCKVGALTSSMPPDEISSIEQYGLCLGYAYQIIDDVLDFVSDSSLLGKPAGNDLLQGNITLPVILALRNEEYGLKLRQLLQRDSLNKDRIPRVLEIMLKTGAIKESIERSQLYMRLGLKILDQITAGPALQELKDTSEHLIKGYYEKLDKFGGSYDGRPEGGNSY